MAQEGAIVRNRTTGAMGRIVNGQVVPLEQQPANPVIAPPDPYKQANEERAEQDQGFEAQRLQMEQERLRLAQEEAARKAAAVPAVAADGKAQQKAANLDALVGQINRVQELYDQGLRDEALPILSSLAEYLPTPANRQFDSAAAGMAEQGLAAFRVPGVGAQSDTELRQFVEANKPTAGDYDTQIEEKLRQLRARVDSTRAAMGLPPASWGQAQQQQRDDAAPPMLGAAGAPPDGPAPQGAPPPMNGPLMNLEGEIAGNSPNVQEQGLLDGNTRREDNPLLAGVRDEYLQRLGRGDSAEQLIRWAREAGVHPSAFPTISAQVKFRRENPRVAISEYDVTELDDRFVAVDPQARAISDGARTDAGAFLIGAGDAASGFTLDNIVGMTGGNAEQARLGMDQVARENPVASTLGTVAGGTLMALGGEVALGARGMAAGLPRAMVADTAYGTAAGAGASDYNAAGDPSTAIDRIYGAGKGAMAGAGGSYAGYRAGNALARVARGVSDPSVNALRNEGVNALTVGQTFGNSGRAGAMVKGFEDRLSGLPVVGDMVNARRAEGLRQFNAKAFDKALEPIGGTVGDVVGEEAIDRAQQQVSQAFTTALAGKGAVPDQAFNRDLGKALFGVQRIKRLGPEVFEEVVDILKAYDADTMLSGEALDDISRSLRDVRIAYRNDPLANRINGQVERVERAIFDLFDRQASGTIPEYMAARQAYRRLSVLEDAVLKSKNGNERMFTASQLGTADRTNAKKFGGKRAAARGDTPFSAYAGAGQDVLPNTVPDSGTVGRALVPLVLVGGGAGADQAGAGGYGLTIGSILAALYSKTGQRVLTKPGRGMKGGTRRRSVMESPATRRVLGATGAAGGAAVLVGPE